MNSRPRFTIAAAAVTAVVFAAAGWTAWLYLDAKHQAAEARALEARKKAQVQVAADFYIASLNRDGAALASTVSAADASLIRSSFADVQPLDASYNREWAGARLVIRTAGAWGDAMRYEFTANGDKRRGAVAIETYVPVQSGSDARLAEVRASVELEDDRWVVTSVGGKTIGEMF